MRLRLPQVVIGGKGVLAEAGPATAALGIKSALVVTDPNVRAAGAADDVVRSLRGNGIAVSVFDGVRPEPPRPVAEACRDAFRAERADGLVAVGGGSVIDVAKAAAACLANPLPSVYGLGKVAGHLPSIVAVPTTPGTGSEVSSHASIIEPDEGRKYAVSGPGLVPAAVLLDPAALESLPWLVASACSADALLHGVEAYLAVAATPFSDALALDGIRLVCEGMRSRSTSMIATGGLHTGLAMACAGAGTVHALGYPLTTRFGLSHGLANALVAPAALALASSSARVGELAAVLRTGSLAEGVSGLLTEAGIRLGLRSYGVTAADVERLARDALHYEPIRRNSPLPAGETDLAAAYVAAL